MQDPKTLADVMSSIVKNAVVLPTDAQCEGCGYFDTSRKDVREMLKAGGKNIRDAGCKGTHPYCIVLREN